MAKEQFVNPRSGNKRGGNKSIAKAAQEQRQLAAEERQAHRLGRTAEQQLLLLDARPGEARSERARLAAK